jgi:hypothetical protein
LAELESASGRGTDNSDLINARSTLILANPPMKSGKSGVDKAGEKSRNTTYLNNLTNDFPSTSFLFKASSFLCVSASLCSELSTMGPAANYRLEQFCRTVLISY